MFRKALLEMLLDNPMTLSQIAELVEQSPKEVEADINHLLKSLRHTPYRAVHVAARCRSCGFVFHQEKLHKPGKCPRCKSTWISEPQIGIEQG